MENKDQLYLKNSLDGIRSPDQLQDYMHVTSPSVWMILTAVIVLLTGLIICAALGTIEVTKNVSWIVENGVAEGSVRGDEWTEITTEMPIRIKGELFNIRSIETAENGMTTVYADVSLQDGTYDGTIVTESITPISFLWNTKDNQ